MLLIFTMKLLLCYLWQLMAFCLAKDLMKFPDIAGTSRAYLTLAAIYVYLKCQWITYCLTEMELRQWTCRKRHAFGLHSWTGEIKTSLDSLQRQSVLLQVTGIDYFSQYHRVFPLKRLIQYNVLRYAVMFICLICEEKQVGYAILLSNWANNPVRVSILGWLTPHSGQLVIAVLPVFRAPLCPHLICQSVINYDLLANYFLRAFEWKQTTCNYMKIDWITTLSIKSICLPGYISFIIHIYWWLTNHWDLVLVNCFIKLLMVCEIINVYLPLSKIK